MTGAAMEIEGWATGKASDWSIERGFPCASLICSEVPADFGKGEWVGFFSGTGWAAV